MGTSTGYECSECGEHRQIDGAGWQCGMSSAVVTVSCGSCAKVSDVEIPLELYLGDRTLPACPGCGSTAELWNGGALHCTCGAVMSQTFELLWD